LVLFLPPKAWKDIVCACFFVENLRIDAKFNKYMACPVSSCTLG